MLDNEQLLKDADFDRIHRAFIDACEQYKALKDDENISGIIVHYVNNLSDMALLKIGFIHNFVVEKVETENKPRKKNNISPENRERQAQRMRDMQARKKAERAANSLNIEEEE